MCDPSILLFLKCYGQSFELLYVSSCCGPQRGSETKMSNFRVLWTLLLFFQLLDTAMDQASELFKSNEDHILLQSLRTSGIEGESNRVEELSVKFEEHIEQLEEVCRGIYAWVKVFRISLEFSILRLTFHRNAEFSRL